jgi:hypothetical protein
MTHQLTWQTTPGARGFVCSRFRAVQSPLQGGELGVSVSIETETEEELESLLAELEMHFAAQRFADEAAALKAVRKYALERAGNRR